MQTDVKAASLSATGSIYADKTRVRALTISYASGGTVVLKDGGSSGTTVYTFTAPAAAGSIHVIIPGEGILFSTNAYATLTNTTLVAYYG